MKRFQKGFGLIELMVGLVISVILLIGVYKTWMSGVDKMSETTKLSALRSKVERALHTVVDDLKMAGYNPLLIKDANDLSVFGVSTGSRTAPYSSLTLTYYMEDYPSCTPGPECTISYFLDANKNLIRTYYDDSTSSTQNMQILDKACVRFLFCDPALLDNPSTRNCYCDGNYTANCTDQNSNPVPPSIKLIISAVIEDADKSSFDNKCFNTNLDISQYVRFEKSTHLTNLK